MAVTITVAELAAALRLGASAEETAEATRLLSYATAAVSRHLHGAYVGTPDAVVNEATVRLAAYLFDQPTAGRGMAHADALRNSGAASMLLPYRVHRAGSTAEATGADEQAAGLGLRQIGSETVDVTATDTWTATALPAPRTAVGAVSVVGPRGTETGIELFRAANLTGSAVAGADATGDLVGRQYAMETAADGTVLFASEAAGAHTVYLFEVG